MAACWRNGARKRLGTLQTGFLQVGIGQQCNTRGFRRVESSRTAPSAVFRQLLQSASATQSTLTATDRENLGSSTRIRLVERAAASVAGAGLAGATVGTAVCASASSHPGHTRILRCRSDDRRSRLRATTLGTLANISRTRLAVCEGLCVAAQVTVPARQPRSDCTAATSSRKEGASI